MLKICGKPICEPLKLIFQSSIKHGKFPCEMEKDKCGSCRKKSDEQILKNYRPVSLIPIYGNAFELLIYNSSLFEYFIENDFISLNQSGFKPGDSCTKQLISITHKIYQSFDDDLKSEVFF